MKISDFEMGCRVVKKDAFVVLETAKRPWVGTIVGKPFRMNGQWYCEVLFDGQSRPRQTPLPLLVKRTLET